MAVVKASAGAGSQGALTGGLDRAIGALAVF